MNKKIIAFCVIVILLVVSVFVYLIAGNNWHRFFKTREQTDKSKSVAMESARKKMPSLKPIDGSDHIWGDKNAKAQIIVYGDFECPACLKFQETVKKIKSAYVGQAVIAFRHYPLRMHADALPAAIASECAADQEKFWEMHDRLFADNQAGHFSLAQFKKDAADLKLDQKKFSQCLDEQKHRDEILNSAAEAKSIGVNGTPTVFINGRLLPGAYPFADFIDSNGDKEKGIKSIIESYLIVKS